MITAPPLRTVCFLFDPNVGGTAVRARAVYARLRDQGHKVRFAIPDVEGSTVPFIAEAGLEIDRLPITRPTSPKNLGGFLRYWLRFPATVWRLRSYLQRQYPDVIHVNGAFDIGPALAGRLSGVPVVWHLNDTIFGRRLARVMGGLVRRIATLIVTAADRVATHYGVADANSMTIYAPVDIAEFNCRAPGGWPRPQPALGLLGNWNRIKRQDRFVEAVARLRAAGRPVRGRIMGGFNKTQRTYWEPILARMAADRLDEVIEAPGFVSDTAAALADIDILLLTSVSEASPICVLEAMSIGIPQVVFDVGGVRELLGEGDDSAGIIVPEGDIDAMTAAIGRILDDPDLYRRMAAAGQARARAHFSLEACVARHEAAYRAAIDKMRTKPK